MPKEKSSEVVSDEAEMERRFKSLEDNAAESKDLLAKIAAKVLGEEPPKKPVVKKDETNPPQQGSGVRKFFQGLGLLSEE